MMTRLLNESLRIDFQDRFDNKRSCENMAMEALSEVNKQRIIDFLAHIFQNTTN